MSNDKEICKCMKALEVSKKKRIIKRILENSELYNQNHLIKLSLEELILMQKTLLIKLRVKQRFKHRHVNLVNQNLESMILNNT